MGAPTSKLFWKEVPQTHSFVNISYTDLYANRSEEAGRHLESENGLRDNLQAIAEGLGFPKKFRFVHHVDDPDNLRIRLYFEFGT